MNLLLHLNLFVVILITRKVIQMNKNHEKAWDEIDKIADENGGHYVVPTKPGEVDTSEVSEYIKKLREKRECEKRA